MNKYLIFILRDYKIIKVCFTILTMYMLYDELYIFFIIKPTLSSVSKSQLRPHNYPDIIICPVPGFDQNAIARLGYDSSYYYSMGKLGDGWFGWFGNETGIEHEHTTAHAGDFFMFKSSADCPQIGAKFRTAEKLQSESFEMFLMRGIFPNGRCCRARTPRLAGDMILNTLYYTVAIPTYSNNQDHQVTTGFKMLLSDRESAAFFMMNKFNLEGSQLVSEHSKEGQEKYKIKIMEEIHMEDEPNYSCRIYQPREYDQCLEAEFTRQTLSLLNCTPPWMTNSRDLWCPARLRLSGNISDRMTLLFDTIFHGNGEVGQCLVPCKKTRFVFG